MTLVKQIKRTSRYDLRPHIPQRTNSRPASRSAGDDMGDCFSDDTDVDGDRYDIDTYIVNVYN